MLRRSPGTAIAATALVLALTRMAQADGSGAIESLAPRVLSKEGDAESQSRARRMLADDARMRRRAVNEADVASWRTIASKEDWERFRDARIGALRRSLGHFPPERAPLNTRFVRSLEGDGYRIDNVVYESRPGLVVTANLYRPPKSAVAGSPPPPGILICHSHHRPKVDGELQDMGMNFARAGCAVLILDQLGHGERAQHPFRTEKDFAGSFRPGRQDYYFRYNVAMQLHLAGESLVGWMAWDMMRGVDVLLELGADKDRIILMGAVAGGGDPAAVTAALDPRIAAVVPFNFGGPQPETTFPLPDDAETSFNYVGGGSWESTRNLLGSAQGGFLPWVIVGSVAPRRLIYAHEFSWDRERDPVWRRFESIYGFYNAADRLAFAHGYGRLQQDASVASHCNHIGPPHRKMIYPALEKWFGIPAPKEEYRGRRDASELLCLTSEGAKGIETRHARQIALRLADARGAEFRRSLDESAKTSEGESERSATDLLKDAWKSRLGIVEPGDPIAPRVEEGGTIEGTRIERIVLPIERQIEVPLLFLVPRGESDDRRPVVVAFAHGGKAGFVKHRSARIAELLAGGASVCLIDVRGTGETSPGEDRGRRSEATSVSSSELMTGQTILGSQLRDLRTALRYLRSRKDVDPSRLALWGDSFAPTNASDTRVNVPLDADPQPAIAEPAGHLLALLGGLFEPDVAAVVSARGGLLSFRSVLQSLYIAIPHDAVVPGCLEAGDLDDLSAAIVPRPLWLGGLVDARNRPAERPGQEGQRPLLPRTIGRSQTLRGTVVIRPDNEPGPDLTKWLLERLRKNAE